MQAPPTQVCYYRKIAALVLRYEFDGNMDTKKVGSKRNNSIMNKSGTAVIKAIVVFKGCLAKRS
jgi:hypothetical protein